MTDRPTSTKPRSQAVDGLGISPRKATFVDWARRRIEGLSHVEPNTGCWLWLGQINPNGYGQTPGRRVDGRQPQYRAHRLSYEAYKGPIPAGLHIDHLCRTPLCVNPEHLEAVTQAENNRRSSSTSETHCRNGHLRTPESTQTIRAGKHAGQRRCYTCIRMSVRRRLLAEQGGGQARECSGHTQKQGEPSLSGSEVGGCSTSQTGCIPADRDLLSDLEYSLAMVGPRQQGHQPPYIASNVAEAYADALDRVEAGLSARAAAEDVSERHCLTDEDVDDVVDLLSSGAPVVRVVWR